ncbi:MAG: PD-(D/E)XK nuclease family protein [Chitinophagaceae bacterium]
MAALCSSTEKHKLGTLFIEELMSFLEKEQNITSNFFDKKNFFRSNSITEWITPVDRNRRIDIVVELRNNASEILGVIGIENKIFAEEQDKQLSDYQNALCISYPTVPKSILFLTPYKIESITKDNSSKCISIEIGYIDIANVIDKILLKISLDDIYILLKSYQTYLLSLSNTHIMKKDIQQNIKEIFMNQAHRETIKYIYENFPKIENVLNEAKKQLEYLKYTVEIYQNIQLQLLLERNNKYDIYLMLESETSKPSLGAKFTEKLYLCMIPELRRSILSQIEEIRLINSIGKLKHYDCWINIWVGNSFTLRYVGKEDVKKFVSVLDSSAKALKSNNVIEKLKKQINILTSIKNK